MKILIICSKAFYKDIAPIKGKLEGMGHVVELPNSYYDIDAEKKSWALTLNFDKNGKKNYIGGATFIEIYEAFMKGKKIFLYNDIPDGMLYDEISGFSPIVINGNLDLVHE